MKVHLKTVLKLDKIGFSLSIVMVFYLTAFHLAKPYDGTAPEENSLYLHIFPLLYALIMALLCGVNVLKIGKIRKKYLKPYHRRYHNGLSGAEE